jgi:chemotaxis protein MotB
MRLTITLCALFTALSGCVSSGSYDQLHRKYSDARAQLAKRDTKIRTLEQAIAEQQAEAQRLAAQIDKSRMDVAKLEVQLQENGKLIASQQDESRRIMDELTELISDRTKLKESSARLQQALTALALRKLEAEKRVAEYRSMLARFKNLIDAGTLTVRLVDGRMVLALPSDVLFDSGSARLSKTGKEAAEQVGAVLAGMGRRRIQVEGHTDNVPIHNDQFPSNWELASARALVVARAMMQSGMPSDAISAASYGEFHPAATNDDPKGRAVNRRIEVVLLPDLSSLPGFEELQKAVSEP